MKLCLALPRFFTIPFKDVTVERGPVTGWLYLMYKGSIVAIAESTEAPAQKHGGRA